MSTGHSRRLAQEFGMLSVRGKGMMGYVVRGGDLVKVYLSISLVYRRV